MDNKTIFKSLADNPPLLIALRELLEKQFPLPSELDSSSSDMLLGQATRARIAGFNAIDSAFREIAQYKSTPVSDKEGENPAR